ncbi:hypothetical protein L873DRAFT_1824299 [Choiromyces venosus 120613-1]|uniref:Uncharacterized protein n=1 Tax=Choiromyces venosus 120613-1 TaxID=1336337 RepID=A0A3N4J3V9_9PEZI|nr:hypothetical protein L873DRAFT_1824299 [Choiromyces venosus 120613-1]
MHFRPPPFSIVPTNTIKNSLTCIIPGQRQYPTTLFPHLRIPKSPITYGDPNTYHLSPKAVITTYSVPDSSE